MVQNYKDFIEVLLEVGFSMGGGNDEGIFAVIPFSWNEAHDYQTPVQWHTGDPETDPWEWRMRVLDERSDIAYSKLFFKKSGYITQAWYPYFLAVRRQGKTFDEAVEEGRISYFAKRLYDIIRQHPAIPLHALKQIASFSKSDQSKFDSALLELQMKMYITMCGRQQKVSKLGLEYGWSSTVFCKVESYFGEEVFEVARSMTSEHAYEMIENQIIKANPNANSKKIMRFIKG